MSVHETWAGKLTKKKKKDLESNLIKSNWRQENFYLSLRSQDAVISIKNVLNIYHQIHKSDC